MEYRQRKPSAVLAQYVRWIWYVRGGAQSHRMERVLPNGCMQMVVNLAREKVSDLRPLASAMQRGEGLAEATGTVVASVLVGMQTRFLLIGAEDLDETIGVVFEPGALRRFEREPSDRFRDRETALADVFGGAADALRDRLLEASDVKAKMECMERFLCVRLTQGRMNYAEDTQEAVVRFAVEEIQRKPSVVRVAELTREVGYSARRFTQVFSRDVGLTPKVYARICRFQVALRQLHEATDVPWAEMAVACGYYDQSHFANDFRAFSGVSPTEYSATNRVWINHVPVV